MLVQYCKYGILSIVIIIHFIDNVSAVSTWEDVFKKSETSVIPLRQWRNKFYYIGAYRLVNWFEALNFCRHMHMNLASIRSKEENDAIYKFIQEAGYGFDYWIGGTKLIDDRKWIWFNYGEEIGYTNWQNGQPDFPNTEKCLQVWKVGEKLEWNDRTCENPLRFICERYKFNVNENESVATL